MSILDQGEAAVGPKPNLVAAGHAPGNRLETRNDGPVRIWLGDPRVAPFNGLPLLPGESYSHGSASSGGVWACIEVPAQANLGAAQPTNTLQGRLRWAITDSTGSALPSQSPQGSEWLVGSGVITDPGRTGLSSILDRVPVHGWRAVQLRHVARLGLNPGTDQQIILTWYAREPKSNTLWLTAQRTFDIPAQAFLAETVPHLGDYFSYAVAYSPNGANNGATVSIRHTNRVEGGLCGSMLGDGVPHSDGVLYDGTTAGVPGPATIALPPYTGPAVVGGVFVGSTFELHSRQASNQADLGGYLLRVVPSGNALGPFGPVTVNFPARINTLMVGANTTAWLTIVATRTNAFT